MKLEFQKGSRSKILAGFILLTMVIFAVRLFYLQIIQHDYYVSVAKGEQVKRLTIPAKRGKIYALDAGVPVPLVMNQTIYTVFADPQITRDDEKIIEVIKKVAGGNARADLQKLLDKKDSRYQILATKISRIQADKIKSENLKGIGFQEYTQRVYPEGALAGQTLGFVNDEGLGQYGVEEKLDERLSGKDGLLQSVTDISDVPLTIGDNNINIPAVDGDNVVLSIDRNIQSKLEQVISDKASTSGADRISAIVIDPLTGRVMALANTPSYNPAEFNKVSDVGLFNNSAVSAPYEPGSDMKTLTMAVGIDKGVVSPTDTYYNTDFIKVDDRVISNSARGFIGDLTFQFAMNWSLNTGFVTVAKRLGDGENITREARNTMYDYFSNRFMLGRKTGIEIAGEASGTLISPEEVEGNAVRYSNMSFGQGLDTTLVQVSAAFCSIVNGGKYYKPTIVAGLVDKDGKYKESAISEPTIALSKSTADQVRAMAREVRTTASSNIDKPGYYIGGKTGTSQVVVNGSYDINTAIGTYLGYGGSEEQSRYVIMVESYAANRVMVGASQAGPVFTAMSNYLLDYLKIQPKG